MSPAGRRAAFFDVDDTLITVKSMFRFLRYDLAVSGRPPADYARVIDELRSMTAAGVPREETNRRYYRSFAGRMVAELAERGAEWFKAEYAGGGLFAPQVLAAFRRHVRSGDLTVLVSGSFAPCLDPIARFVGADVLLCSRPEVHEGRYTGDIAAPMIGTGKLMAARAELAVRNISWRDSYAYGDHVSDLPLLELVDHPVVIGNDPVMREHAERHGWTHWPNSYGEETPRQRGRSTSSPT